MKGMTLFIAVVSLDARAFARLNALKYSSVNRDGDSDARET